jgi:hypothetical protein
MLKLMGLLSFKLAYKRNLPHIQPPGATLFVTFRLAGSISQEQIESLIEEFRHTEIQLDRISDEATRSKQSYLENGRMFDKWDALLDASTAGPEWLLDIGVARQVAESLEYRHGKDTISTHTAS